MNRVLALLIEKSEAGDFLSGQEIAKILSISRAAVWKHIQNMREMGFVVEAGHKRGYRISRFPENILLVPIIERHYRDIAGKDFPLSTIYYSQTASTNNMAKQFIVSGKKESFLLLTDEQTAGRGRLNRTWHQTKGLDIAMTLSLQMDLPVSEFYKFTMIAGLSVFKALRQYIGNTVLIKWPNDIYIENRKICGILSEMITEGNMIQNIIIGIGINVNSKPVLPSATSILTESGKTTDRNRLLAEIVYWIDLFLETYKTGSFHKVFAEWRDNLGFVGRGVRIDTGREVIEGVLKDVEQNGGVIIATDGEERLYYSGDLIV